MGLNATNGSRTVLGERDHQWSALLEEGVKRAVRLINIE
jgi:hypothetical protein